MFASLGERLDEWIFEQHLRWFRIKRRLPGYKEPPRDEVQIWSRELANAFDRAALDALVNRQFENDMKLGKTISFRKIGNL